jgi:hypothetical protein
MGGMCVSMLLFSARGRTDTSTPAPPKPVRHRTRIARCPVGSSLSPAAAEPDGFRVAHCQGADDSSVVDPTTQGSS